MSRMTLFENWLYIKNLHFKRLLWLLDGKMSCTGQEEKQGNQLGVWVRKETSEVERSISHILSCLHDFPSIRLLK